MGLPDCPDLLLLESKAFFVLIVGSAVFYLTKLFLVFACMVLSALTSWACITGDTKVLLCNTLLPSDVLLMTAEPTASWKKAGC